MTSDELAQRVAAGDRRALARLLSWIENAREGADDAMSLLYERTGRGYSVGITGAPGAGKSTLTDQLIAALRARDETVGVVAVDPTSPFTGGALLGDRIRMGRHAGDAGVFIRSMANRGHLGGLSVAVPQAARALDAYGADWILIETVGVGQVEVEVAAEADTTLVVVNPGWGDHVQTSKAGLIEIADVFVVNKADRPGAKSTARDLRTELTLAETERAWRPPIVLAVAATGEGIDDVLGAVEQHRAHLEESGELDERRRARVVGELREAVRELALARVAGALAGDRFETLAARVVGRELSPVEAARTLFDEASAAAHR